MLLLAEFWKSYFFLPRLLNKGRKRRFPIAEYNKLLKRKRQELIQSKLEQEAELKSVTKVVHKLQQRVYKRKKKVVVVYLLYYN